jgi:hypothetical protein
MLFLGVPKPRTNRWCERPNALPLDLTPLRVERDGAILKADIGWQLSRSVVAAQLCGKPLGG